MKSKSDPRHLNRRKAVQSLFANIFGQNEPQTVLSKKVIAHIPTIDKIIFKIAPKWPIEKINKVDLAVLRLAIWELQFNKRNPQKVVIDEAIELAKEFGSESSAGFVNGALGSYLNIYAKDGQIQTTSR